MDKIGLKRFFYFQFVSKDNVKDLSLIHISEPTRH